jgi:hypothetical protein
MKSLRLSWQKRRQHEHNRQPQVEGLRLRRGPTRPLTLDSVRRKKHSVKQRRLTAPLDGLSNRLRYVVSGVTRKQPLILAQLSAMPTMTRRPGFSVSMSRKRGTFTPFGIVPPCLLHRLDFSKGLRRRCAGVSRQSVGLLTKPVRQTKLMVKASRYSAVGARLFRWPAVSCKVKAFG